MNKDRNMTYDNYSSYKAQNSDKHKYILENYLILEFETVILSPIFINTYMIFKICSIISTIAK